MEVAKVVNVGTMVESKGLLGHEGTRSSQRTWLDSKHHNSGLASSTVSFLSE